MHVGFTAPRSPDSFNRLRSCDDGRPGRNGTSVGGGWDRLAFCHFLDFAFWVVLYSSSSSSTRILVHCAWTFVSSSDSVNVLTSYHLLTYKSQCRILGYARSCNQEIKAGYTEPFLS